MFVSLFGKLGTLCFDTIDNATNEGTQMNLTLSAPALQSYVNRPDHVRLKFHFSKSTLLPWLTIVSARTTNENFRFSYKNWRVHTKRPKIVCFPLYKKKKETFYRQKVQCGEKIHLQYLYNTNFLYLSNELFHHQSTQENWNISNYFLRNNSANISL